MIACVTRLETMAVEFERREAVVMGSLRSFRPCEGISRHRRQAVL